MEFLYSKDSVKFLQRQPQEIQARIIFAIEKLPAGDVVKLQGKSGYRLRVGGFRVHFERNGNIVMIKKIGNRGQVYKR